jgi:xylulokinase
MSCFAAVDVGTSVVKAMVFDEEGRELGAASRECETLHPAPGWAEFTPDLLLGWPLEMVGEAVEAAGVASRVQAIGVTGARATVMALDGEGRPLANTIPWLDRRSGEAARALGERLGGAERFYAVTGVPLDATPTVTKILSWREHDRGLYDRARIFANPQTTALHGFTGEGWYLDHSYGPYFGLMDLAANRWSEELLAAAGIDAARLPQLVAPGTVVGTLSRDAAAITGLAEGTAVVAAGADASLSKLGAGVRRAGEVSIYVGTAGAVGTVVERPVIDPKRRMTSCTSALAGHFELEGLLLTAGSAYRWTRDVMAPGGSPGFEELNRLAALVPPGSDGLTLIPHLAGAGTPLWNSDIAGTLSGVRLSHGPGHLARAVIEGVAFANRHVLAALAELVPPFEVARVTGGASRSPLWAQILADATGLPIEVPRSHETTLLAAATISAAAVGAFPSQAEAIARMTALERRIEPDASTRAAYDDAYARYLDVLSRNTPGERP